MTEFTIMTTDKSQDDAITATRLRYNNENPQNLQEDNSSFIAWFAEAQFNIWTAENQTALLTAATEAFNNGDTAPMAALIKSAS